MDSEFVIRLLDCMFFNQFISERGSPWRSCDIWDDLYNELPERLRLEAHDPKLALTHIQVNIFRIIWSYDVSQNIPRRSIN
jgi:myotubularin-related protein 5/13